MRRIYILYYIYIRILDILLASLLITFLSTGIGTSINMRVPCLLSRVLMSGLFIIITIIIIVVVVVVIHCSTLLIQWQRPAISSPPRRCSEVQKPKFVLPVWHQNTVPVHSSLQTRWHATFAEYKAEAAPPSIWCKVPKKCIILTDFAVFGDNETAVRHKDTLPVWGSRQHHVDKPRQKRHRKSWTPLRWSDMLAVGKWN